MIASPSSRTSAGTSASKDLMRRAQAACSSSQIARARSTLKPVSRPVESRKANGGKSSDARKRIVSGTVPGRSTVALGSQKFGGTGSAFDGCITASIATISVVTTTLVIYDLITIHLKCSGWLVPPASDAVRRHVLSCDVQGEIGI